MKKLILILLLLPVILPAQSLKNAIFGNAATVSNAVVIPNGALFTGLYIPDDIDSDAITFTVSRDGTNYFNLQRTRPVLNGTTANDSSGVYTIIPADTSVAYYVTLPEEIFRNIRRMKITLDAASSASEDTVQVVWKEKPRWF